MKRVLSFVLLAAVSACTNPSPAGAPDSPGVVEGTDDGKSDTGLPAAQIAPALLPMYTLLRDDKNLVTQLGPEGTTAAAVKKRVKVVKYTDFGTAVDTAVKSIAKNYYVEIGDKMRRAVGLIDLLSVGDMYVSVKSGYGEDAYIDKLITESKRAKAQDLARALLPEAALISADHASTTSTGNYILVLGDISSGQAIVMTVEYQVE